MKTDIARLSFEAFPEYINKQLISLMLLDRQDLIWIDLQIERRVATLRVNIFVGENAGNRMFKVGALCLIGIAHLTEANRDLKFSRRFELRPFRKLNLTPAIQEEIGQRPAAVDKILMNLFHAVKLVCAKTLVHIPISGNIVLAYNGQLNNLQTQVDQEALTASQFAYEVEEKAQGQTTQTAAACQTVVEETATDDFKDEDVSALQDQSHGPMGLSELDMKRQGSSADGHIYAQVHKPGKNKTL